MSGQPINKAQASAQASSAATQQGKGQAQAAEDSATRRCGKYELGKVLGTGSFSKVRECIDTTNRELYAVKIIDKAQLAKEHLEEQLKREISILKQLRHRFIVSMKEVLQTTRHIYIVLELVTGGELFDRIVASERLHEDLARKYFQQLVVGIRHCHKHGVAHRDLKPENILIDSKTGDIKISDFGLANLQYREGDMMRTVVGTPNYVAPEVIKQTNAQAAGTHGYDGLMADVWSIGIILYVMLSGHQAFDDRSLKALFNKIERGQYAMSRHFSEGARKLIQNILIVDPAKRYSLNDIICDPWFQVGFDAKLLDIGTSGTADPANAVETVHDGVLSPQATALGAAEAAAAVKSGAGASAAPPAAASKAGIALPEDGFQLAKRLMLMGTAPAAQSSRRPAIPGPGVSPSGQGLEQMKPERSSRSFMYRGNAAQTVEAVYNSLAAFVPAFAKPAVPSTEIKGHAVFKGQGRGTVLTYLIEVRPVAHSGAGEPLSLVELKFGIGDRNDFIAFFQQMASKVDQSKVACAQINPPWNPETLVTKRAK